MSTSINKKIANYYFQDSQRLVYATALGHLLLVIGFLMSESSTILTNPYAIISGLTAVLFFSIHKMYNWKNHGVNLLLVGLYLLIFAVEMMLYGIPPALLGIKEFMSTGVLFEFLMALMPYIYVGMRIILVIPLIRMTYGNYQLKQI